MLRLGSNVGPGLWSASEVQVGVFSANLPSLSIFLRRAWTPPKTASDMEAAST